MVCCWTQHYTADRASLLAQKEMRTRSKIWKKCPAAKVTRGVADLCVCFRLECWRGLSYSRTFSHYPLCSVNRHCHVCVCDFMSLWHNLHTDLKHSLVSHWVRQMDEGTSICSFSALHYSLISLPGCISAAEKQVPSGTALDRRRSITGLLLVAFSFWKCGFTLHRVMSKALLHISHRLTALSI